MSLFLSLSVFFALTAFNYSIVLFLFILLGFALSWFAKVNIKMLNFVMISYVFVSTAELIAHKYIMHCKNSSFLDNIIQSIPLVNEYYNDICSSHIQHHLEVEPDMHLNGIKDKSSLFISWYRFSTLSIIFLICVLLSRTISNYKVDFKYLLLLSAIVTLIWEYIWNKTHATMHKYEGGYSIKSGPYENVIDATFLKNALLQNHAMHHLQKGDKKGNYNVIFLGADEWFGLNNKKADNTEYCKTHQQETICKEQNIVHH
jgi:hypothetical protein